jgi:hypothetical protein
MGCIFLCFDQKTTFTCNLEAALSWCVVCMTNYIAQPLNGSKQVVICLDLSVVVISESIIGNPSEYLLPSVHIVESV